jgi:hypothetical protein
VVQADALARSFGGQLGVERWRHAHVEGSAVGLIHGTRDSTILSMESQDKRDAMDKARAASVASRKQEAARKRAAIERRARQRTPGHHESCRCESCEAVDAK